MQRSIDSGQRCQRRCGEHAATTLPNTLRHSSLPLNPQADLLGGAALQLRGALRLKVGRAWLSYSCRTTGVYSFCMESDSEPLSPALPSCQR